MISSIYRYSFALLSLLYIGVTSLQADELSSENSEMIVSLNKMISAIENDAKTQSVRRSPTQAAKHGIFLSIEGLNNFQSFASKLDFRCRMIKNYNPESWDCTKSTSNFEGLYLIFTRDGEAFKLTSGMMYGKAAL